MSRKLTRPAPRRMFNPFAFTPEPVNAHLALVLNQVRKGQLQHGPGIRFGLQQVPGDVLDGQARSLWFVYAWIDGPRGREEVLTLQVPPAVDVHASFRPQPDGGWLHVNTGRLQPGESAEDYYQAYAARVMDAQKQRREQPPAAEGTADE